MSSLITTLTDPTTLVILKLVLYTSPVWLTITLIEVGWHLWLLYKRTEFIQSQKYVLLEIKMPKEIFKSPRSMEFLYNALYQPGGEDHLKIKWDPFKVENEFYWKGSVRAWFSLEMCSINGKLHFYIWSRASQRAIIEAQLYSQYPGIEIYEVPDYTLPVMFDASTTELWGAEFMLTKDDAYPIKTYIDYGMDKDPKEEFRVDPMTPLVEFLGSLPPEHTAWIQILIQAHKAEDWDEASGKMVDLKWAKGAEKLIKEIHEKAKPAKGADGTVPASRNLSEGEKEVIYALERSISKYGFDTGIRAIYFAPKDIFQKPYHAGLVGCFRNFNSNNLNGLKTADNPNMRKESRKHGVLEAYKNRGYFWNEFKHNKPFVLNTEELATIFHLPSGVTTSSGVDRIGSKKAPAPSNLPS